MAESSIFWTTGVLGDGTNPYTMAQITQWLFRTLGSGIHAGWLNEMLPTSAAPNVTIESGSAVIRGFPYENTVLMNVNIPVPLPGTARIDRIVLRAVWATQTVRVYRIAGVVDAGVPPGIVQNNGVTWDEMICQASITDAGVITVTDERTFSEIYSELLDSIVTSAKIDDGSIVNADVNAAAAILQSKISNAGPTIDADTLDTFHEATFARQLDMDDIQRSRSAYANNNVVVPPAWDIVPNLQYVIALDQASDLFIWTTMQIESDSTRFIYVRVDVNAVDQEYYLQTLINGEYNLVTCHWYVAGVPAGNRTIQAEWRRDVAALVECIGRRMTVIVIPN